MMMKKLMRIQLSSCRTKWSKITILDLPSETRLFHMLFHGSPVRLLKMRTLKALWKTMKMTMMMKMRMMRMMKTMRMRRRVAEFLLVNGSRESGLQNASNSEMLPA